MSDLLQQSMAAKLEFFRVADLSPQPGTFHDLFLVRTRLSYLPEFYERYSGAVAGFEDNGLNPADHKILRRVVSAVDGITKFPKTTNPRSDYGASIGLALCLRTSRLTPF